MKTGEKFWILWCPTSEKPPTRRFFREEEALKVAEKMALDHPGSEFVVMLSVIGVERSRKVEKQKYSRLAKPKKVEEVKKVVEDLKNLKLTYNEWKQKGRQVKSGEKSERIYTFPGNYTFYRSVFTYSQTQPLAARGSL